jgi:hypothetical protein
MATISNTPVWVEGSLNAGNIRAGRTTIVVPSGGNHSVAVDLTGMSGTGQVYAQVTPQTTVPGGRGTGGGTVTMLSVADLLDQSFTIWIRRTSGVSTEVYWFATRNP